MLASEITERVKSEWLYPAGIDRPAYFVLDEELAVDEMDVTFAANARRLPQEAKIQIDQEVIIMGSSAGSVGTLIERGAYETEPAVHPAGSIAYFDPAYFDHHIFQNLQAVIGQLGAYDLYERVVDPSFSYRLVEPLEMPEDCRIVLSISVRDRTTTRPYPLKPGKQYDVNYDYEPPLVSFRGGGGEGDELNIVYGRDFVVPSDLTDDLTADCGVPESLQPYLPMAVAGYMLQGKVFPQINVEEIRRLLGPSGNVQMGAPLSVGQMLQQTFRTVYVAAEAAKLRQKYQPRFEFVR